jgi:hypothetical protein
VLKRWGVSHLTLDEEAEVVPQLLTLLEVMRRVR